ncbi:hypothetical protein AgCh_013087 [Apium graveolens]
MEGEEKRDYYEFGVVGVTDRVVDFIRDVVPRRLDFPLPDIDDEEAEASTTSMVLDLLKSKGQDHVLLAQSREFLRYIVVYVFAKKYADFDMFGAQQKHALAVERLVPRLKSPRMEICPGYGQTGSPRQGPKRGKLL